MITKPVHSRVSMKEASILAMESTIKSTMENITESNTESTTKSIVRNTIRIMENMKENNIKKIAKNWEDGEIMTSDRKFITLWDGLSLESQFFQVAAAALWDASRDTTELL